MSNADKYSHVPQKKQKKKTMVIMVIILLLSKNDQNRVASVFVNMIHCFLSGYRV